ncbi:carboxylesterase family protein [Streptomyces sp. A3M-1-3]|uniref:carboxylesterase/lipase family protein n=1 Tax=Streptomyces sp. A3M-1-3 TaxID=2962044 RepID=UPI0020B639E2|nr:carboxylesterase family protein [Streptomyces sp. A3M-1-3]MCP3818499.1 carboxylesterase family protein [Streptomyces sp. A3M-1-3]
MKPVVMTTAGSVEGTVLDGLRVFKGIPYAAPPDGLLRFEAPAPPRSWDGVRPARRFSAAPPQLPLVPGMPALWRPEDGMDCLSVNVWTPGAEGERLPVMVWIYGGGWKSGYSGDPTYDGSVLARDGVVMVTFNYRVGFEGFGYVPGAPANRGFLDQAAALRWVRENIDAFGGDPDNVTIFGESGGGASVAALMTAPASRGLFRRAIVQSMAGRFLPEEEAKRISRMISDAVGVEPEKLTTVAPEALLAVQDVALPSMEADPTAWTTPEAITAFSPVIDGVTVVDNPWLAVRSGAARDVELICGYTRDEFTMFSMQRGMIRPRLSDLARMLPMAMGMLRDRLRSRGRGPARAATPAPERGRRGRAELGLDAVAGHLRLGASAADDYRAAHPGMTDQQLYTVMYSDALFRIPATWLAEAHAAAGGRSHLYEFAWTSPVWGSTLGAVHTLDIPVTFGHADGPLSAFLIGRSVPDDFTRLSRRLRDSWISFATTGDPGWPQFTTERPLVRIWDTEPSVAEDPLGASRGIWRSRSGL